MFSVGASVGAYRFGIPLPWLLPFSLVVWLLALCIWGKSRPRSEPELTKTTQNTTLPKTRGPTGMIERGRSMVTEIHNKTRDLDEHEALVALVAHPDFPSVRKHLSERTMAICDGAIDASPRDLGASMHRILRYVLDDTDSLED